VAEGLVEQSRSNNSRAATLLREAAGIIKSAGMPDRALYGELLSYLAYVYLEGNQPAAAIEVTLESAQIEKELGVTDTSTHLNTLQNLATLWFQVGEIGKALAERELINQLSLEFYTAQDMEPSLIYNGAVTLLRMDRPKDALAMLANHLERVRNAEEPAMLLRLLHAKAWTHTQLGEWAIAEQALAETQPLLEQGAGNPALHSQLEVLRADIAVGRQDTAAARQHIAKALSICGYGTGVSERAVARVLITAANLALASSQPAAAERYARDAVRISAALARGPDSSADVGEALLLLAKSRARRAARAELVDILGRAARCLNNGLHPQHRLTLEARSMLEKL
jgi:hypothetical protein